MTAPRATITRALSSALAGAGDRLANASAVLADGARVARFARGALELRVRPDDVFISSYPRSGTTWLQYIVHLLLRDGDMRFGHISEVVPWYERSLALGALRAEDFERMPSPRIFKSHLPSAWLPRGARYIYAVRDGRDVAVSYHHLYRSHLGSREDFDAFFERFLRGAVQYGSWFDHVASFTAEPASPKMQIVSYEALSTDLAQEVDKISAFLGHSCTDAQRRSLVRACSFEAMKQEEQRFDHATEERALRGMQTGAFVREGRCGSHAAYLNAGQLARFEEKARAARRPPSLLSLSTFLQ